jgi:hypothetical protein
MGTRDQSGHLRGSSAGRWRSHSLGRRDYRVLHFAVPLLLDLGKPWCNGFIFIVLARRALPSQLITLCWSHLLNLVHIRLRWWRIVFREKNGSGTLIGLDVAVILRESTVSILFKSFRLGDVGTLLVERNRLHLRLGQSRRRLGDRRVYSRGKGNATATH